MTKIILITGASGSGKTTVTKYLSEKYSIFHFDDIGVPDLTEMILHYGSPEGWQEWATKNWIEKLSKLDGGETVILEGSFNPEFAHDYDKLLCLDTDRAVREKRLREHRKQPELVSQDMENFARVLKEKTLTLDGTVIDSSKDIHDTIKACLIAIEGKESLRFDVPITVAKSLIAEQFPEYSYLKIKPVEFSGWDNATYRLGDEMLIRLPRGEAYALKVAKEQVILKILGQHLSIAIPQPIALGRPSVDYPFHWSICRYLEGDSANSISITDLDLELLAVELASFLKELHSIETKNTPLPGLHNHWRGNHVSVYECGALSYFKKLSSVIDTGKAIELWGKATSTKWNKPPVWIHGDLAAGNFLIKEGKLSAVIDFGGCAAGDPACDLAIAYTFFKDKSREKFKHTLNLDEDTWLRAKAWVLWKAGYELTHIEDKSSSKAIEQIRIFKEVLDENNPKA